jgi:hypothetical protein
VIDHRAAQTPVRHQGDRPTCVGFAVSGAHEWIAGDGVARSAEDAIWAGHQVASVAAREETSVAWSLEGLERHDHATEAAWPYGNPHWSMGRPAAANQSATRRTLPRWSELTAATFESVRGALRNGNAVILTLRVVRSAWRGPDGLIDAEPGRKTPGNHAVLAVAISVPTDAKEEIVIKNSWGVHWGVGGYGTVTRRYFDSYALRAHVLAGATG